MAIVPFVPEDQAPREAAQRLSLLIPLLLQTRPAVVLEIEQSAITIVTNDVRRQIWEKIQGLSADEVRTVEALVEHLFQERRSEENFSPPPPHEDGPEPDDA
jgi:hypothetical protein